MKPRTEWEPCDRCGKKVRADRLVKRNVIMRDIWEHPGFMLCAGCYKEWKIQYNDAMSVLKTWFRAGKK